MADPRVSVIMGIYNCADTLEEAIESLMAQTYTDFEIIMCDDASTDDTYKVAEKLKDKYPSKIVLICNETNSYLAYSLNHCLKYAKGEYIARMDGDDKCLPDRFEKQVTFLDSHPKYDVVGTYMQHFTKDGFGDITKAVEYPDKYTIRDHIPFNHATIMMKKSVYDALGGYTISPLTRRSQDREMWYRFFKAGYSGANIPEPLYLMREDLNAFQRRTARVRWNGYKITRNGYKLLGFPWHWRVKPFIQCVGKIVIPSKLQMLLRKK